jgi:hypothetical protein
VVKFGKEPRVRKLEVSSLQWNVAAEMEATLSLVAQLTTISQHERAWTGAFYPIVSRRLISQCSPESLSPCIPLDGDMAKIKRVDRALVTLVGLECKARALKEAQKRFDVPLTPRQMIAAIVDPRTKGLKHLNTVDEKKASKAAFKEAYIKMGHTGA